MLIQVGKAGTVQRLMSNPGTAVSNCLFQSLLNFQVTNTPVFPPPPKVPYWVRLNLDPATRSSAGDPIHQR